MPPKPKYDREAIIDIAVNLVREKGADSLTAREMAEYLGTSSRPIFTAFQNMSELKAAVISKCSDLYEKYFAEESASGEYPQYKAMGMAYVRLAIEESNAFKLLFMRDRSNESKGKNMQYFNAVSVVKEQTGYSTEIAERMHFEMWVFVHGIATMLATGYVDLDFETVSELITDAYQGIKRRFFDGQNN